MYYNLNIYINVELTCTVLLQLVMCLTVVECSAAGST